MDGRGTNVVSGLGYPQRTVDEENGRAAAALAGTRRARLNTERWRNIVLGWVEGEKMGRESRGKLTVVLQAGFGPPKVSDISHRITWRELLMLLSPFPFFLPDTPHRFSHPIVFKMTYLSLHTLIAPIEPGHRAAPSNT